MHCVGSYSFIHSFTRPAHSSGAEQLVQHFRILLAIISYKHTVENDLIMKRKLTACCPCLLVLPLSLLFVLSRSHALGGSSCCCHLGLHSSAKHPFPPFAVPLSHSLVVSVCDMMWYVALCLCVCVCLLCIFQIELHIAGHPAGQTFLSTEVRTGHCHCIPIVAQPAPWLPSSLFYTFPVYSLSPSPQRMQLSPGSRGNWSIFASWLSVCGVEGSLFGVLA